MTNEANTGVHEVTIPFGDFTKSGTHKCIGWSQSKGFHVLELDNKYLIGEDERLPEDYGSRLNLEQMALNTPNEGVPLDTIWFIDVAEDSDPFTAIHLVHIGDRDHSVETVTVVAVEGIHEVMALRLFLGQCMITNLARAFDDFVREYRERHPEPDPEPCEACGFTPGDCPPDRLGGEE